MKAKAAGVADRCFLQVCRFFVLFLLLGAGSCGFSGEKTERTRNVLRISNMAEPAHLDPARQTVVEDQTITLALFENLLMPRPGDLQPEPGAAKRWEVSEDGLVWTFYLREALWSNGDPVQASDFVYSFRRVITSGRNPKQISNTQKYLITSPYADLFFCIAGAEAWFKGELDDFDKVGLRARDSRTLEIRLVRPVPWFAELLSFATFSPVHPPTVERYGAAWTRVEHFVGNGPFVLSDRRLGEEIRVRRNPKYWDASAVGLDEIVYYSSDQVDTALDMFLAGETDWVRRFNPKKVRAWRADPELSRYLFAPDYLGTYFLRLNVTSPKLKDVRVRRALAMSVDRDAICRYVTGLGERPAEGLVPPFIATESPWRLLEGRGLAFNPSAARELWTAAGMPMDGSFELTLSFASDLKNKAVAEVVQRSWKQHLGVTIHLENREKRVHVDAERALNYEVSRGSWIGDYNDPTTFLDIFRSGRGNNRTGWSNAAYDTLLNKAEDTVDPVERQKMLERAEEILMVDDPPLIGIYYYKNASVLRMDQLTGFHENPRDIHPPKYIRRR